MSFDHKDQSHTELIITSRHVQKLFNNVEKSFEFLITCIVQQSDLDIQSDMCADFLRIISLDVT
jgi:hypothetical protein